MDPVLDNEWLFKNEPIEEPQNVGNIALSWQWRERGIDPKHCPPNKTVFENIAEDILVQKPLKIRSCDLPGYPRSTFLMVFSPDGTKVASTHGNHNVYVSELASGKHVRILKGHPRTPWCIAFHPSHPQLIGSGCLGGQVRVWDIASGGSEVWNVRNETVIASIAFHPREQLLVIATYNELYFWDWSQSAPCTKVSTSNVNEKVRYVAFDALGYKLITGISLWPSANNPLIQQSAMATGGPQLPAGGVRRASPDQGPRTQDSPGAAQDMIVNSYQNLVQRYDSLVRNYQRLFMVRHRLTPSPPNTIDRGTDPMETDQAPGPSGWTRSSSSAAYPEATPTAGTSRNQDTSDQGDIDGSGSRLLNFGALSFDSDTPRDQDSFNQERSSFGSPSSAFQPLNDIQRPHTDLIQPTLLPNPFSTHRGPRLIRDPLEGRLGPWAENFRRAASDSQSVQESVSSEGGDSIWAQSVQRVLTEGRRNTWEERTHNAEPVDGPADWTGSITGSGVEGERGSWAGSSSGTRVEGERGTWAGSSSGTGVEGERGDWAENSSGTGVEGEPDVWAGSSSGTRVEGERDAWVGSSRGMMEESSNGVSVEGSRPTGAEDCSRGTGVAGSRRTEVEGSRSAGTENSRHTEAEGSRGTGAEGNQGARAERSRSEVEEELSAWAASLRRTVEEGRDTVVELPLGRHSSRTSMFATISRVPPRRFRPPPPATTNSSTQVSPSTPPVDAHAINESLDLIRDILRDSGTRLLNLITNMSLSTLASVERRGQRRPREESSPRPPRLLSPIWRRSFLSSSSDSDSDHSLEVNILRTRNSTFQENEPEEEPRPHPTDSAPNPSPRPVPASAPPTTTAPTPAPTNAGAEQQRNPTGRIFFELNNESRTEENQPSSRDTGGINFLLSSSRFRVRTQGTAATGEDTEAAGRNARPSTSRGSGGSDSNPSRPSTSRDNFWTRGGSVPPDEAYRKVRSGVSALQKHTMQLTNLWLRGNRTTMRELRTMWENLRRRILMLHRETGRQDLPSYYTRSLLERCMILTEMSDGVARPTNRTPRTNPRAEDNADRSNAANRDDPVTSNSTTDGAGNTTSTTNSTVNGSTGNTSHPTTNEDQTPTSRTTQMRSSPSTQSSPSTRRRLQSSFRWRAEDEFRRRSRNATANRLSPRYSNRSRRDFARAIEISATRHEIRMRAMQVLSVMFNMMMMCLEERGLSQLIINMLRTLKKALALTCLMLMTNRNSGRGGNPVPQSPSQRVDSLNVVRIQNVDHTGPVNVDGPEETISVLATAPPVGPTRNLEKDKNQNKPNKKAETENNSPSTSQTGNNVQENIVSIPISNISQRWSNRLAVQIAAANRNNSATARNRRELYMECKRLKALHRTNPNAHPFHRKRMLPPVSTHRIPSLRYVPSRTSGPGSITPRVGPQNMEPVAGPSNAPPNNDAANQDPSRNDMMNEFEHRVNFIRIAHMQAVRLRNAARNRFRRLQTIRLYTPSSVREMFSLQNNAENQPENRSPLQNNVSPEIGNRRSFTMYRTHILAPRGDGGGRPEEPGQFHTVLNNVAVPLVHINDLPSAAEAQGAAPFQRMPRVQEYLQPIILAQNAMVVDEEGGAREGGGRRMAGMAGLLDAGILSEALPAPSHRVQAWDFTIGEIPDIADCTKNVVVQRCRIHNDASIDISKDGRLLVALLPVPRLRNTNHWLGVYSLEWARLGQCLHTAVLEQSAVSVALSPTARHLAVGLGSRRFTTAPHGRNNVFALLYRLDPLESSSRTGLSPIKELEQNWEHGFTSLNCLRWAPQPGQGLVYANNTGQLIIMS